MRGVRVLTPDQRQAIIRRGVRLRAKRPTVKMPVFPRAAELAYTRALKGYVQAIAAAVREHVFPVLDFDGDGVANVLPLGDLTRALTRVQATVLAETPAAERAAQRMLGAVNTHVTDGLNASYKRVLGIEPFKQKGPFRQDAPASVDQVLRERLQDNVSLIGSVSSTLLDQVQTAIREGFAGGLRVEDLAKQLEERFGVAESRAILIARDQTGKLNAQLTEARNRELGVTEYVWQISGAPEGDARVRERHRELEGQTFRYDDPPVTNDQGDRNNPGEDYQCRCTAQPRLENVLDALGI